MCLYSSTCWLVTCWELHWSIHQNTHIMKKCVISFWWIKTLLECPRIYEQLCRICYWKSSRCVLVVSQSATAVSHWQFITKCICIWILRGQTPSEIPIPIDHSLRVHLHTRLDETIVSSKMLSCIPNRTDIATNLKLLCLSSSPLPIVINYFSPTHVVNAIQR